MEQTTQTTPAQGGGNGLATTSLILGIVGVILSWIPVVNVFGVLLDLTAVILGFLGRGKAKKVGKGGGSAMIGLVLGIVGLILFSISWYMVYSKAKEMGADLENSGWKRVE